MLCQLAASKPEKMLEVLEPINKIWQDDLWEDYMHWQMQDSKTLNRKVDLISYNSACLVFSKRSARYPCPGNW
jgi:hypothetical protein